MTVYVDDLFDSQETDWRKGQWCHMWTDGDEREIHQLASRIGLLRSWFQTANPRFHHYDLRPSVRVKALQAGAVYMPLREWIKANAKSQR